MLTGISLTNLQALFMWCSQDAGLSKNNFLRNYVFDHLTNPNTINHFFFKESSLKMSTEEFLSTK